MIMGQILYGCMRCSWVHWGKYWSTLSGLAFVFRTHIFTTEFLTVSIEFGFSKQFCIYSVFACINALLFEVFFTWSQSSLLWVLLSRDTKIWNTNGVEGVHRFLGRAWRLVVGLPATTTGLYGEGCVVTENKPSSEQLRILHQCIQKVTIFSIFSFL